MPNEVQTRFTGEPSNLFKTIDAVEARHKALNAKLNGLNGFGQNPTFGSPLSPPTVKPIDALLVKAQEDIRRYRQENISAEKELTRQIESEEKQRTRIKIREAKLANDAAIREIRERERAEKSSRNSFSDGIGTFGVNLGGAAIVGGTLAYGKLSLDAARDADAAQRILRASAKETGISFDKLSDSAAKFGAQTLQSNSQAQSSFAQIVTFANSAGRSDKLDEFRTKFSDLAAAKGIDPSKLGEIAKQLNALTDEATDKLLGANPSAFYDKFAKSIGKTANSLSDAEKRAAVFDEVLKRGTLFSGEAERRINASASALDRLSQKFDNFKASSGKAVLPLVEFLEFAQKVAAADASLYRGADENQAASLNRQILEREKIDLSVKTLRDQDRAIRDAISDPNGSLKNFALSNFNLADNFFNPEQRQKAIDKAIAAATDIANAYKSSFEGALADKNSSAALLKLGQKEFYQNQNLYDNDTRRRLAESFETGIAERERADADKRKAEADKARLEAEKKKQDLEKAVDKIREIGRTANNVFDGLFNRLSSDNPIAQTFFDGEKALNSLKDSLRGLPQELQAQATAMQQKLNNNALFAARLGNDFASFDLRDEASAFRNFRQPKIEDPNKFFADFIENGLKQIAAANGGIRYNLTGAGGSTFGFSQSNANPFTRYNSNIFTDATGKRFTNGFSQSDARSDLFYNFDRVERTDGGFGGFSRRRRNFADLTEREKSDFINKDNLGFQDKLSRQVELAQNRSVLSDEQRRIVDRKLISLTQGVDPSRLTSNQRDAAAGAREREAAVLDQNEQRAREQRQQQIELQTRIAVSNEKLIELARKGGSEQVIKFIDETSAGVIPELKPSATAKDTQKAYDDAYAGGTYYEQSGQ